jgi:hypothetical protein
MARNASGAYTLPTGNPVVTDTTVTSTWGNTTMTDVATEMTASLSRTGKGGMLAPLKTINGTAGAPVYTFTNFPTSGWYIAGAGDVRMSITGTDRLKVLATGIEVAGNITTTGTAMTLGQNGSTFQISRNTADQTVQFSGGSGTGVGANLIMYGQSHASAANDFYLRSGTTVFFSWNDDIGQVQLSSGTTPTANLTLTGNSGSELATFAGNVAMAAGKTVDGRDVSVDGAKLDSLSPLLTAVKEADESVTSSTTLQDDDDLQVTLEADSFYKLEAFVFAFSASTTPDFKYLFVASDGSWSGLRFDLNGTQDIDDSFPALNLNLSAGTAEILRITVSVQTGGSGGVFKLQWAQNISNGTATTVKAGSFMRAEKLA